jgi:hypothetical protein
MEEKIKKLNEQMEKEIHPNQVRQYYILFKNAEFEILRKAEAKLKEMGIYGKNRVIAVACMLLLKELNKKNNGKKS